MSANKQIYDFLSLADLRCDGSLRDGKRKMEFCNVKLLLRSSALRGLLLALGFVGMLLLGQNARAQGCLTTPSGNTSQTYSVPTPLTFDPKTPNGTVLFSRTVTFPGFNVSCIGATATLVYSFAGLIAPTNGVFPIAAGGQPAYIGVRVTFNGSPVTSNPVTARTISGNVNIGSNTYTYEFIKMGQPPSNVTNLLMPWVKADVLLNGTNNLAEPNYWAPSSSLTIIPLVRTCTTTTSNITIPLGSVAARTLGAIGSTSPTSSPQSISLSCSNNPSVSMVLKATQAAGQSNNTVVGLTSASLAQGVGVQLLYNNNPLAINGSVTISNAAGATLNVPIAARYYRTGALTQGSANAAVTLQFTYN
ncbi:hypothetical protein DWU98_07435 [Dyella monticola]|uniref:Uncharacterized protein n=2 Tax=Dyella monticola TaxID=1927958 RepID=A0A370X3H4_9GAMM|nr:fimbrial protein [Dyella monticola]RDS82959.1 hypothetical protein DWU98_07435 [Dyella monticola]